MNAPDKTPEIGSRVRGVLTSQCSSSNLPEGDKISSGFEGCVGLGYYGEGQGEVIPGKRNHVG